MDELMDMMLQLTQLMMKEKELVLTAKFPEGTMKPVVTLTTGGVETNVLLIQIFLATLLLCLLAVEQMKRNGATLETAVECYRELIEQGIRDAWGKEVAESND